MPGQRSPVVLVLGASGQVGRQILASGKDHHGFVLHGAARSNPNAARRFDLERPDSVARVVFDTEPQHVVLTAAATNVDWCEAHPAESHAMNVVAPQAAARAARDVGASLTFISTDYVFDGSAGPYGEGAPTNPLNVYGAHKLEAEGAVLAAAANNLVIRSCQVFGPDQRRANFVLRVVDQLRRGESVSAADDLLGTPTYAPDLAALIIRLTVDRAEGLWHAAGPTFLSRYELATRIAVAFGYAESSVVEVATHVQANAVNRPRRAGLVNDRLAAADVRPIRALEDALMDMARQDAAA